MIDLEKVESALAQLRVRTQSERTRPIASKLQDEGILGRWIEDISLTEGMTTKWGDQIAAVMRDSRFSNEGRRGEIKKIGAKALIDAKVLPERMEPVLQAMTNLRSLFDFRKRPKEATELLTYLREKEVRDSLWEHPQHERDVAFLKAAERGDIETMQALTLNVPGGAWVNKDVIARGEEAYGQRVAPESVATLEKLEVRRDRLQGLIDHVARTLLTMGAQPDEIKAALGIDPEEPAHA